MGGHLPPWVNTLIYPNLEEGGCEIWKGGIEMGRGRRWSMHLGHQQQFQAAHSLYMKVVLRSLRVLNAIVCSSCCSTISMAIFNSFLYVYQRVVFQVPWLINHVRICSGRPSTWPIHTLGRLGPQQSSGASCWAKSLMGMVQKMLLFFTMGNLGDTSDTCR